MIGHSWIINGSTEFLSRNIARAVGSTILNSMYENPAWNSTNHTNWRLSLSTSEYFSAATYDMGWRNDKKCGSLFYLKSCLPPHEHATTIATANFSISMHCALNFLAHNSTLPVWIIIFLPSWRHGNLMKENRKPINHQPSRLCWNQYTLPTKPAFLPKYWWGEALQGRYDFLVQHEVRWWLSQTFF